MVLDFDMVFFALLGHVYLRFQVTWLVTKHMQTKKVSKSTFLHQIERCFGILFGLSAKVNKAFIFDINTNLNENHKEMS